MSLTIGQYMHRLRLEQARVRTELSATTGGTQAKTEQERSDIDKLMTALSSEQPETSAYTWLQQTYHQDLLPLFKTLRAEIYVHSTTPWSTLNAKTLLTHHMEYYLTMKFANGNFFLNASNDELITVPSTSTKNRIITGVSRIPELLFPHQNMMAYAQFGSEQGELVLYDYANHRKAFTDPVDSPCPKIAQSATHVAYVGKQTAYVADINRMQERICMSLEGPHQITTSPVFTSDGNRVAFGTTHGIVCYSLATKKLNYTPIDGTTYEMPLAWLNFSRDDQHIIFASATDRTLGIAHTGNPLWRRINPKLPDNEYTLSSKFLSPQSQWLVTQWDSKEICIYNIQSGKLIYKTKLDSLPKEIAFSPDDKQMSIAVDEKVILIDLSWGEVDPDKDIHEVSFDDRVETLSYLNPTRLIVGHGNMISFVDCVPRLTPNVEILYDLNFGGNIQAIVRSPIGTRIGVASRTYDPILPYSVQLVELSEKWTT